MNKLELRGEKERVVCTALRVWFAEVRGEGEQVRGLVGDDDVGSAGQSVVKVPQAGLQAGGVTHGQRHSAIDLTIVFTFHINT